MSGKYLSDEELARLMAEVENEGLIKAPDRIEKNVLGKIHAKKKKVKDFRLYCMRVGLSVAAAITIIFVGPLNPLVQSEVPSREVVKQSKVVTSKEEAMAERNVKTREEAINDKGTFENISEVQELIENKIEEYLR